MLYKRFLLICFTQMVWVAISAQTICVSGGINRSIFVNNAPFTGHALTGFEFGAGIKRAVSKSWYIEPTLSCIGKGMAVNSVTVDSVMNLTNLAWVKERTYNVELKACIGRSLSERYYISVYPYASYLFAALYNPHISIYKDWHTEQQKVIRDYTTKFDNPGTMFHRLDFGFGAKGGIRLYHTLYVEVGVERGLATIDKAYRNSNNQTVFLSLNYYLNSKKSE